MSSMWIGVEGVGYGGFSGGLLHLITEFNNYHYYYKIACQGTSLSRFVAADFFGVRNDVVGEDYDLVEHDHLLMRLTNNVVKVEIPDVFIGRGTVELTFELYSRVANMPDPLFKCRRRFSAKGISLGDVKINTQVQRPKQVLSPRQARGLIGVLSMQTF